MTGNFWQSRDSDQAELVLRAANCGVRLACFSRLNQRCSTPRIRYGSSAATSVGMMFGQSCFIPGGATEEGSDGRQKDCG
jgi:hypothetical protein